MKDRRLFVFIMLLCFIMMASCACAESDNRYYSALSDEQLNQMMTDLAVEKHYRNMALMEAKKNELEGKTNIMSFQGIDWLTSFETVNQSITLSRGYIGNSLDYGYFKSVNPNIGKNYYFYGCDNAKVAGYTPNRVDLSFVFPVVDGVFINDESMLMLYRVDYSFSIEDYPDFDAMKRVLSEKLTILYGEPTTTDKYYIWKDSAGNTAMIYKNNSIYFHLVYDVANAEQLVEDAFFTYQKTIEEDNVTNFDGL